MKQNKKILIFISAFLAVGLAFFSFSNKASAGNGVTDSLNDIAAPLGGILSPLIDPLLGVPIDPIRDIATADYFSCEINYIFYTNCPSPDPRSGIEADPPSSVNKCTPGDWDAANCRACNGSGGGIWDPGCSNYGPSNATWCSCELICTGANTVGSGCLSSPPFCGDGACGSGETCSTCPGDCGACPSPPTYSCTGSDPQNATLCSGDGSGLSSNTAKAAVKNCGSPKCEYQCISNDAVVINNSCLTPVNGDCGTAATKIYCQAPTLKLCSKGDATSVNSNGNKWTWTCKGQNTGSDKSCEAFKSCAYKEVVPN